MNNKDACNVSGPILTLPQASGTSLRASLIAPAPGRKGVRCCCDYVGVPGHPVSDAAAVDAAYVAAGVAPVPPAQGASSASPGLEQAASRGAPS